MAHRVVTDTSVLPRMTRDVARHNRRVREAVRRNISHIVANEHIITSERDRLVRVSIPLLKEWHLSFDHRYITVVGHGDGFEKVKCPVCGGTGCKVCGDLGIVSTQRARRIKRWVNVVESGPDGMSQSMPLPPQQDEDSIGRKGGGGLPRSKPGDRLGKERKGKGNGEQGGTDPGIDAYEAEITVGEIEDIAFEELGLPNLEDRGTRKIKRDSLRFDEIRRVGPMSALDKRRTLRENLIRNARERGKAYIGDFDKKDMRFRTWEVEEEEEAAAVVFALMDVSGSMDEHKKFLARTFYAWLVRFLRTQYDAVDIVFISHHTEARECTEEEFFHHMESGGTYMSSAWTKALEIMKSRYSPDLWNIYAFHFSDGYNWSNDNNSLIDGIRDVLAYPSNMVGYGEIHAVEGHTQTSLPTWARPTGVIELLSKVFASEDRFVVCRVDQQTDVWEALQSFLSGDRRQQSIRDAVMGTTPEATP
jgi:hypothetical protein